MCDHLCANIMSSVVKKSEKSVATAKLFLRYSAWPPMTAYGTIGSRKNWAVGRQLISIGPVVVASGKS